MEEKSGASSAPEADPKEMPRSREAIRAWVKKNLDVNLPLEGIEPTSASPLDYLEHVFVQDEAGAADCIVWANRGGGKTFLGAVATVMDMVFKPGIQIRILGGSLEQSRRMHAHLRGMFGRESLNHHIDGQITERRIRLTNGSEVELLAQSQTSVRGTRVQKLRCDEVELFTPAVWEAAQLVTRTETLNGRTVHGSIECFSTMHLPYGLMHRLVEEAKEGSRKVFRWSVVDTLEHCEDERDCETCPLLPECGRRAKLRGTDDAGHVRIDDAIRQKRRVSLAVWDSEMRCLRPSRSDCVFPEFDVDRHVTDWVPEGNASYIGGMDFGTRSPTVVLWGQVDNAGVLWIVREYVKRGATLARHMDAMSGPGSPVFQWLAVDPAGNAVEGTSGSSHVNELCHRGFHIVCHSQRIAWGVNLIRARLDPADGAPRLKIHSSCRELIRALETYHYDALSPDSESPVKDGPDHCVDALRYLVGHLEQSKGNMHRTY